MLIQPIQNLIKFQGLGNKILVQNRRKSYYNDYPQRHYENNAPQNKPQPEPEIKTEPKKWYENPYYINQPVVKTTNMSDYKISPEAKNILLALKDKEVQETKGKSLDDKFVVNTIKFLINEANPKEKSTIINDMTKLRKINYNKVDENEISILEHIINAEDIDLLNLANNAYARLDYYAPLDYAYENIQNPEFKEEVDKLNLNFKEVKEAVKSENFDKVSVITDDFYSPFYKRKVQGAEIGKILIKSKNSNFYGNFMLMFDEFVWLW